MTTALAREPLNKIKFEVTPKSCEPILLNLQRVNPTLPADSGSRIAPLESVIKVVSSNVMPFPALMIAFALPLPPK